MLPEENAAASSRTPSTPKTLVPVGKIAAFSGAAPVAVKIGAQSAYVVSDRDVPKILLNYCPHNGCGVDWKATEFVCPCHGSRFAKDGSVEIGPAQSPMPLIPSQVKGDMLYAEV